MVNRSLTLDRLKSLLDYDAQAGVFVWKVSPRFTRLKGKRAGCLDKSNGYRKITIDGVVYLEHLLAWFYVKGVWPIKLLDHKNRDTTANWINNLREATTQQNGWNRKATRGRALPKGVYKRRKRFAVIIRLNNKAYYVGSYLSLTEAVAAHAKATCEHRGEFAA